MSSKHIPVRECIVCGKKFEKNDLVRIASKDNKIFVDPSHKSGGRGAYICKNPDCSDILLKKRRLDRAFKKSVETSVYEEIIEELKKIEKDEK
ncbi:MAG: YlxR family protein [Ruminococcaceae bacterium]|nr:YlxR family protein [Oscillospiraceae bacterium]